jgi:hypothetical protein
MLQYEYRDLGFLDFILRSASQGGPKKCHQSFRLGKNCRYPTLV